MNFNLLVLRKIVVFIFLLFTGSVWSAVLSIEGMYQGKNLYIQNPVDDEGFGFCVTKVTVNGDIMPGGMNVAAFEVNFSDFNLALGESVFIEIISHDGCKPKILNPEVLLPRSTFIVEKMTISNEGKLQWITTKEEGKLPFIIEQYRWNKWVRAGEVQGIGNNNQKNEYTFVVRPHSGENIVRVTQVDHTGKKRPSKSVKFTSTLPRLKTTPQKVKKEIQFLNPSQVPTQTKYEIYDAYGNIVKKGVDKKVDCSNLKKGIYYVNFDNTNEKFIKN